MTARELDAAGITDPALRGAYGLCRTLNARHGRTYFLATRLLPLRHRPAVHALYGFARYVDDLVDEPAPGSGVETVAAQLAAVEQQAGAALSGAPTQEPVMAALRDTAGRYRIDPALFMAFLASMRMDLEVGAYPDRAALQRYTYGSAQVIGLQMLPVLGTVGPQQEAASSAAALGEAFQLTNFVRDVAEDLDRGRVYLPADELATFGVDRERLDWCRGRRRADAAVRAAIADQVERTRAVYRQARPGVAMLLPESRPCIETAFALYAGILDRVERADYDVFAGRAAVGVGRKLRAAGPALVRAWWARRPRSERRPDRGGRPRSGGRPSSGGRPEVVG